MSLRQLCRKTRWWCSLSSFLLSLAFLERTGGKSTPNRGVEYTGGYPPQTWTPTSASSICMSASCGVSNLTVGRVWTLGVASNTKFEISGGGPWKTPSPLHSSPPLESQCAIPFPLLASCVEAWAVSDSLGDGQG